jgi:hypothetical protein
MEAMLFYFGRMWSSGRCLIHGLPLSLPELPLLHLSWFGSKDRNRWNAYECNPCVSWYPSPLLCSLHIICSPARALYPFWLVFNPVANCNAPGKVLPQVQSTSRLSSEIWTSLGCTASYMWSHVYGGYKWSAALMIMLDQSWQRLTPWSRDDTTQWCKCDFTQINMYV